MALHEELVEPAQPIAIPWFNYGRAPSGVAGAESTMPLPRTGESLQIDPGNGTAWWGLANLRAHKLEVSDIASLEHALSASADTLQRVQLHFALGRALGDHGSA